ncbi:MULTISPECIES: response regulator [Treponema]|jgi:CheY-like chemotaxis protein|uniref:response regulator n=1 Tax=Treponema TaxID=157 RepID=UPI00257CA49E|nr:response regulator [Treponema sp.]MBQ5538515.1 response regulator [Treponema sp.]
MGQEGKVVFSAMEVAKICGVVNQTAINWIKNGYLEAFTTPGKQYRIEPDDLVSFMVQRNMTVPKEVLALCKEKHYETKSLLIVDDDRGLNTVVKMYMQQKIEGLSVFQAFDGFEAGALMVEKQPSCLILDLDLPGVDGFGLCRKISENAIYGKPSVIVVTALDDASAEERVKEFGVKKFFRKPLNLPVLFNAVSEIL